MHVCIPVVHDSNLMYSFFHFWQRAVTHTSANVKTRELLHWTAPPAETGPVSFLYAVVVQYDRGDANMFYATLQTMPIAEGETCVHV